MIKITFAQKILTSAAILISLSSFSAEEYKGTVVPLADESYSTTTNAYDRGWVLNLARPGQIVQPEITNEKGEIVSAGTIVINGDPATWQPYLDSYTKQLAYTEENKKLTYLVYDMVKGLREKNALSEEQFTNSKTLYEGAIGQYEFTKCLLEQAQITVKRMQTKAVYEGMVKAVTQASGSDVGNATAVEIVQLNPIGIIIDMPIEKQLQINPSTPIKIYIKGIEQPYGGSRIYSSSTPDGYRVWTGNYQIKEKNTILENTGTPILREWVPVANFYFTSTKSDTLGIPPTTILKDEKGSFVWRAKDQKVMDTEKGIDYTFPIEKVYITTGDQTRYQTGYNQLISLKDKGSLAKNDLILNNPPNKLKDGETVLYPQNAYLLMPGDEVKVVIGEGTITNTNKSNN